MMGKPWFPYNQSQQDVSRVVTRHGSLITRERTGHHLARSFLFIPDRPAVCGGKPVPVITVPTDPKRKGDGHCHTENMVWM